MTTIPASAEPTDTIDYCTNGCFTPWRDTSMPDPLAPDSITPWVEDRCGCCGGQWGLSGSHSPGRCRGIHIEGQVWHDLLMAEQEYRPDHSEAEVRTARGDTGWDGS